MQEPVRSIHNRPEPRKSQRGGTCSGRWTTLAVPWRALAPPICLFESGFPITIPKPRGRKLKKIQIQNQAKLVQQLKSFRAELVLVRVWEWLKGFARRPCKSTV